MDADDEVDIHEWRAKNRDWTRGPTPFDTDFQRNMRELVDWTTSPLGPMDVWPIQLRSMVQFLSTDPRPSAMLWGKGDDMAFIYNDAYSETLNSQDWATQGQPLLKSYPAVWARLQKVLRQQYTTGQVYMGERAPREYRKSGVPTECYVSFTCMPLISQDDGSQIGVYNTLIDHTDNVLLERRSVAVHALEREVAAANSLKELWPAIITGLAVNEYDVPMAMLYSVDVDKTARRTCTFEGAVGIKNRTRPPPPQFDLDSGTHMLNSALQQATKRRSPVFIQRSDGSLPDGFLDGIEWRGHGIECPTGVMCAIRSGPEQSTMAFLFISLNPKRPYDVAYRDFIRLLIEQVTTTHVANILLRAEIEAARITTQTVAREKTLLNELLVAKTADFERASPMFVKFSSELDIGIGVLDENGNVIHGNAAWRRFTGVPEGTLEPFSFIDAAHPDDQHVLWEKWRVIMTGKPISTTVRLKVFWTTPDGQQLPTTVLVNSFVDTSPNGTMTVVSSVVDVSELTWVGQQLRARTTEVELSELKYRRFADMAPVGVAVMCRERRLQFTNESFVRIMSPPNMSGDFLDCICSEDAETVHKSLAGLSDENRDVTFECRLRIESKPDLDVAGHRATPQTQSWILGSAYWEEHPDTHIVCWVTDITAQKTAQGMIQRRMDEALEMKRQQEHFIDMTSHEIRNPLSAMIHCTEEIIENNKNTSGDFAKETLEAAYTIDYCAKHIRNIVGDVLTLSKLDSKLVEICPLPVQPKEVTQKALRLFYGEARAAGVKLEYQEDLSMAELGIDWVVMDPNRFVQVLVNLVTNAMKFTKTRPERRITVRLSACADFPPAQADGIAYVPCKNRQAVAFEESLNQTRSVYLVVAVEDTGCGIGDQEKTILFQRFRQASPKTETQYGGSGLGLYICRDLTELQGGGIGVSSRPGVGSTFVFYIEAKYTTAPELPSDFAMPVLPTCGPQITPEVLEVNVFKPRPPLTHTLSSNGVRPPRMSAKKILVVEDNLINQKVLAKQLRKRGCEVATAMHGDHALSLLRYTAAWYESNSEDEPDNPFDVVLMDMEMPVMDGMTCIREIRALEHTGKLKGKLPIIAVTANVRDELTRSVLAAGADAITTKPYAIDELVAQIEKACSWQSRRRSSVV